MKKNYVSPLMVEVAVVAEQMLAASGMGTYETEVNTKTQQLDGGRRGEWGDLWN